MNKKAVVTVEDILQIKPGTFRVFYCGTVLQCRSAQSQVQYAKRYRKPDNVGDYTTKCDYDRCTVTVSALPVIEMKEVKQ